MDRHFLAWFQPVETWLVSAGVTFVAGLSGYEVKAAQVQAINPLLIMLMIPVFTYGVYPAINRLFRLTPLRKIAIGMFLMVSAFAITAYAEMLIARQRPAAHDLVADTGVRDPHGGRSHGLDHLPGVLLHPGAQDDEVADHGPVLAVHRLGQLLHRLRQFLHPEPRRHEQTDGASYYWFFTGSDAGDGDSCSASMRRSTGRRRTFSRCGRRPRSRQR